MFKAIGLFLQPYMTWIIGGAIALAVGAFGVLYMDNVVTHSRLTSAQNELKAANMLVQGQRRAIEAIDRIEQRQDETNRMIRGLNRRVRETEGADQEISPAAAAVWRDGIVCLRAHNCDTGSPEALPSP
jgi:uncharacterized protein HemX